MKFQQEKRASYRKPLEGRVIVSSRKLGKMEAKATDLSITGMCVHLKQKVEVRQIYRLAIDMKVRGAVKTINALAEAVSCTYSRSGLFKVGMRFLEVDGGAESVMAEYVDN